MYHQLLYCLQKGNSHLADYWSWCWYFTLDLNDLGWCVCLTSRCFSCLAHHCTLSKHLHEQHQVEILPSTSFAWLMTCCGLMPPNTSAPCHLKHLAGRNREATKHTLPLFLQELVNSHKLLGQHFLIKAMLLTADFLLVKETFYLQDGPKL